jgi:threonine synthase
LRLFWTENLAVVHKNDKMNLTTPPLWLSFPESTPRGEPFRFDLPASPCHWLELQFKQRPALSKYSGIRRFAPLIPFADAEHWIGLGEPCTPVEQGVFYGHPLQLKLDFLMPTGSYKDRGTAALMQHVRVIQPKLLLQDSSGNAGISVAAYAARLGIPCRIFVPTDLADSKRKQLQSYGAEIQYVAGNREAVTQALLRQIDEGYLASHVWNPLFLHGTKTFLWELLDQVESGHATWPDEILFPVGNGTLLLGCYLAVKEMERAGCLPSPIRLSAAQTQACAPLSLGKPVQSSPSIAPGIAIGNPPRMDQILAAISETHGRILSVSESEIQEAGKELFSQGWYTEFTSAVALAAWKKTSFSPNTLIPLTGTGLKNP